MIEEPCPAPYVVQAGAVRKRPTAILLQQTEITQSPLIHAPDIDAAYAAAAAAVPVQEAEQQAVSSPAAVPVRSSSAAAASGAVNTADGGTEAAVPASCASAAAVSPGHPVAPLADSHTLPQLTESYDSSSDSSDSANSDSSCASNFNRPNSRATRIKKQRLAPEPPSSHGMQTRQRSNPKTAVFVTGSAPAVVAQDAAEPHPLSYAQAMSSSKAAEWEAAMNSEVNALISNGTASLIPQSMLPERCNVIGGKWVFTVKRHADGSVDRYKARYVCQGFRQKHGIDYDEVFAPVGKHTSFRMLIAYAAFHGLSTKHMDVKTAFLNSDVDENIYVKQPEGYRIVGVDGRPEVLKLNKSLYGLKQAPRNWHRLIDRFVNVLGFKSSDADACVYSRSDGTLLLLYVDDLVIFSKHESTLVALSKEFSDRFKMSDLGPVSLYLGIQVRRDASTGDMSLDQSHYIDNLLTKFNMATCKPQITPAVTSSTLSASQSKGEKDAPPDVALEHELQITYASLVGALLYLSVCTRPDISHAVMQLTRKMQKPCASDLSAAKRVLRYLKGHKYALTYRCGVSVPLLGFADANFAGDLSTRRSTGGYVFMYQGAAISWRSKLQPIVTLSSTEAEYVALCSAVQEVVYLRRLFASIGNLQREATVIYEDNQSAIALAHRDRNMRTDRTKHIDVRYHYIREQIAANTVKLLHVPTESQLADILTKDLEKTRFMQLTTAILNLAPAAKASAVDGKHS